MNEEMNLVVPQEETALEAAKPNTPSIWTDPAAAKQAYSMAKYLAASDLVPEQTYRGKPANCLVALDIANRANISPLMVMQNLYIVKGKPTWSGSFCVAAVNGCGKFTPLEFVFVDQGGGGCFARATRLKDNKVCQSDTITMQMANDEGWANKTGSKWKTMPRQMMMYRAASFFARTYCPEVLLGIQTVEEVQDVKGYDEPENDTTKIHLSKGGQKE